MSLFSKLFGKPQSARLPLFPEWAEQQGDISMQACLDRYTQEVMGLESYDGGVNRTADRLRKDLAVGKARVTLLALYQEYHGGEKEMDQKFIKFSRLQRELTETTESLLELRLAIDQSSPNATQPPFPEWAEQQGDISIQDFLDRYIHEVMGLAPYAGGLNRTVEEMENNVAVTQAEVTLLEEYQEYHGGEGCMSKEYAELLRGKRQIAEFTASSSEMHLEYAQVLQAAKERIAAAKRNDPAN